MPGTTLEANGYKYESQQDWAEIPPGYEFPDASGVAVDTDDNVYILNRGAHPVIVVDKNGKFVRSWGEGQFGQRAHGIHASLDGYIWTVNDSQHCVKKHTKDGKLVMTIGQEGQAAEKWSGVPFNRPTNMGVSPTTGDVYITDGYGNARVHRYTAEGKHVVSWGEPGIDPGQFQIPHNVVIDRDENVYVTDREGNRVQVFDKNGKVQAIWQNVYRPQALCMDDSCTHIYVGEMLMQAGLDDCLTLGHHLNVYNLKGERQARLGDPMIGDEPTQFIAPHGFDVDSKGNLYVGEVSFTVYGNRKFNPPRTFKAFRRLERVN